MDFIQSTPGAPAGKKLKIILNSNVDGSIYVDKRGNRIVDEGARRDVIRDAVLGTPERYAYTVQLWTTTNTTLITAQFMMPWNAELRLTKLGPHRQLKN